ncbi:MAG: preprotein translocase subunit SecE [Tenericutes bacterium]|jgi:preprotein translocase SecE subunit|nr:preprotein translocase subunit SecE [Mycoplasmatota bacterium]
MANNKEMKPKKNNDESRVMSILKTEYKFENWLLAILAPVLILYGVYIMTGQFGNVDLEAILGRSGIGVIDFFFNTTLKRMLTGGFLILVGTLVIVYLAIPFVKPSLIEMKKVNWPSGKKLAESSGRVFTFLLFLMLVFVVYDLVLNPLFTLIYG